ncbi:phage tail tape measure protein [Flavobacterium degerlachei]|uniref:Phage tail tape measure protein, TP901 family, core region n=1 Tax=Flavobacterium degerlachei TaxID=229203 RepID=A0A1H2Z563_9FLAO|nr:phage tail tape measure protein [Flavobacterium degerlachei]SDX11939.1 phage tail tape measure protein, TP901 family, core region [Flavobacterium degerlachei]
MSNTLSYMIQINSNVDKANSTIDKFSNNVLTGIDKIQKRFNSLNMNAFIQNVSAAADGIASMNKPGLDLSTSMYDLQAITGVTGQKLKDIEGYARQNAKTFGGEASQSAESYKLILSQLSPEIAKVPKALQAMGREASITSKLMGGDTVAATNVLTTALNQYQVALDDPIAASKEMARMNNVMAASAKEGSAELPQIAQALEQSGLAAKTASVGFEETNAWIQVLDKNGKKGAEGGVALRNVMATLAQGRFLPKDVRTELKAAGVDINKLTDNSVSLSERIKPLKNIMQDQALVTKLFGKENSNAAIAMISNTDEAERLTKAVTGTNTAYEQAAIIMESPLEKNKRLKAQIDDFKISLFNGTNGWIGYADVLGNTARDFSNLMPIMQGAGTVFSTLTSATKLQALWTSIVTGATSTWTGAQAAFNAIMAINPVVLIVAGVVALVAVIALVVSKTEGWGKAWKHTVNGAKLLFVAYVQTAKAQFNMLVNGFMIGINKIQIAWYKFKNIVGLGNKAENNAQISQLNTQIEARKKSIVDGYKKAGNTAVQAAGEFRAAYDSVKWKKEKKASEASGISTPGLPGTNLGNGGGSGNTNGGSDKMKKSNEAVATGGTKHNYITIKIEQLIGLKADNVNGGATAAKQSGEGVTDELLRILAMAGTANG